MIKATVSAHLVLDGSDIPERLLHDIKARLTWDNPEYKDAQFRGKNTAKIPRFLNGYHKKGNKYYIAREFWPEFDTLTERYGYEVKYTDNRVYQKPKPLKHTIKLWKSQKRAVDAMMDEDQGHQGVLEAPCGGGKTVVLLYLAAKLGQQTLILTHTNDLLQQWKQRCEQYLGFTPGLIQGNTVDIKQITLASVMTLAQRELTPEFLEQWGMVILDEAHHCPAESFKTVMTKFPAYFRFGATATPNRTDNLEGLLFSVCGNIVARITYDELEKEGRIVKANVVLEETGFTYPYHNMHQWPKMVTAIKNNGPRNRLIAQRIVEDAISGATVQLVLSNHIDHLVNIRTEVTRLAPRLESSLLVSGDRKSGTFMSKSERLAAIERARTGDIKVLFGTSLADEGLDLPILDRVHLTFPTRAIGKIAQQIGRIQRAYGNKRNAVVHDYIDNVSLLRNQASQRRTVYKGMGLEVTRRK